MKPPTQYTKSGRINIAYQVFGSGPIDLVYIPGWVSNIDWMWACPELVYFLQELGKVARVILFDKRGTGLSDRMVELSTLEERMDDIRAVMDAVGSQKAILFGHSEGGSVSALFAATYPDRTLSLITFGIFAKRRYAPDYPWAPTDEERQILYDMIEYNWGGGEMQLESLAPSKAKDRTFMEWLANYFRSGASPSAAMVLTKMNTQVDIVNILGSIKVPTLIMQRTNDIDVKIEEGRFIAERIPNSKFVELDGSDHLFWVGNADRVLAEMKAFITEVKPIKVYEERLFTILAARIITADVGHQRAQEVMGQLVEQYRGKLIPYEHHTLIATFEGPSKAVHCSIDLVDVLKSMNVQLSIGIHIKEGLVNEAHFLSGETENFIDLILSRAEPGQVLFTQAVKYLLSGSGVNFAPCKMIPGTGFSESISLFMVTDHLRSYPPAGEFNLNQFPKNDSFLENVLQSIDNHLSNEAFSVEMLCRDIGMSERQLQRKLKAISNKSPIQLISSVRLHRAKELLLAGEATVAEIAFETGFTSPSYFSKCFKKEFGISPSTVSQKQM
ncbi:alpha/beta fold hydrolase [Flavilitoribacter nigricans]|uniref:Adenylate/guanylate cyclase domain-containing protein n=1 Tax=Flavilitoribacter nigricans (strain ATCC 23147 / DSM 23189 / NBRC 102662 / NCIMB 1420 / SS-2) TaxID=1122177 RepID=A0A2D0N0D3_FLAN2|nr:alpha/beta fold hydrolase [Flavilitoribacter nigricans]PHN01609.1 adenylate/guanylate cyclase domain-containing protein [Flavilitoribacter nigricans DSM 23189 = NBRC 102662]